MKLADALNLLNTNKANLTTADTWLKVNDPTNNRAAFATSQLAQCNDKITALEIVATKHYVEVDEPQMTKILIAAKDDMIATDGKEDLIEVMKRNIIAELPSKPSADFEHVAVTIYEVPSFDRFDPEKWYNDSWRNKHNFHAFVFENKKDAGMFKLSKP